MLQCTSTHSRSLINNRFLISLRRSWWSHWSSKTSHCFVFVSLITLTGLNPRVDHHSTMCTDLDPHVDHHTRPTMCIGLEPRVDQYSTWDSDMWWPWHSDIYQTYIMSQFRPVYPTQLHRVTWWFYVGRCGVVVAHSLSDPWVIGSNPSSAYFHIIVHQPSASWDHWRSAHWTIKFVDCCSSLS